MYGNFFCYIPSNNDCALGPDRGSGSINIDLVIDYLFNNTTVCVRLYLYAVLYDRTPESVIEVPKKRIKASKPDPGEQIDQRKRQMLRASIAASSCNTCHLSWTGKSSFPSASSSEHNFVTIISIPAETEEHQTKGI